MMTLCRDCAMHAYMPECAYALLCRGRARLEGAEPSKTGPVWRQKRLEWIGECDDREYRGRTGGVRRGDYSSSSSRFGGGKACEERYREMDGLLIQISPERLTRVFV